MNIVVLYGGRSPESTISEMSARQVVEALNGESVVMLNLNGVYDLDEKETASFDAVYQLYLSGRFSTTKVDDTCEVSDKVIEICKLSDIVFLSTHGGIGESGKLQALLDIYNIAYTGNGYSSNVLSLDKTLSKKLVRTIGIQIPSTYQNEQDYSFPMVIKPNDSGSSLGVHIVHSEEELLQYDLEDYIAEEYVVGREFSVGIVGEKILPPIEIMVTEGYYDYQKKYTPGVVEEICPAPISEEVTKILQDYAKKIHDLMGFEVCSRSDFIIHPNGEIYFIETNSIPGMTPTSLLPKEAEAEGIDFATLCKKIIQTSLNKPRLEN